MAFLFCQCDSKTKKVELTDNIKVTYKDILNLRLQILSTQMTSGSYSIIDMGDIDYPVSIHFNDQNKIVFEIEKRLDNKLSTEIQKEIIEEGFIFVKTAINELIRIEFENLNLNVNDNLLGYWYFNKGLNPIAKLEKGKFEWVENKK